MAALYQLTANPDVVIHNPTRASITLSSGTSEAANYYAWLDAGNTPDPFKKPIGPSQYDWGPRLIDVIGRY